MSILSTQHLTKYYGNVKGIDNLNMEVKEGEIFGFIGPNGAGKSTTIRTLLSLIFPTSGSATIFGKDILKEAKEIKRHIGYLPSDVNFYDRMRVQELVKYSAKFYGARLDDRYQRLTKKLEVNPGRQLNDLSSGNKKKVAILLALLHRPKLLILDEPTSGLDPLMQNVFFEVLKEENRNGTTIFFSSHILSEVQRFCQRVAVIRDGSIVATESIEELRKKQLKVCRLALDSHPDERQFHLEGIENLRIRNHNVTFSFAGNPGKLLAFLQRLNPQDVTIEEPPLEDVFMKYYEAAHPSANNSDPQP